MPAIESMYEPAKKIIADLRENIETGQYAAILGDDASGRLPALLFRKVLNAIYEERKFDQPKTLFFAGREIHGPEKEKVQQDFIGFLKKAGVGKIAEGKKVLFVTDTIASGEHLLPFTEALQKLGVNFDIITMGIYFSPQKISEKEKFLGGKIFWGQPYSPLIYGKHHLSGAKKSDDFSLFAKPVPFLEEEKKRRRLSGMRPEKREVILERARIKEINQSRFKARKEVEILAQKLIEWYRGGGQ